MNATDSPTPVEVTRAVVLRVRLMLAGYRLPVSSEAALQGAIAEVLERGMPDVRWEREKCFNAHDRIDLWSPVHGVGIECKIEGSLPSVIRQLQRYAAEPSLRGLVLVTTRSKLLIGGEAIGGKPFYDLYIESFF